LQSPEYGNTLESKFYYNFWPPLTVKDASGESVFV